MLALGVRRTIIKSIKLPITRVNVEYGAWRISKALFGHITSHKG